MKDLGEADVILGVKIRKIENKFSLYIEKILKRFNCHEEIPVRPPYDLAYVLKKNNGDSMSQAEYAKIIGSVMFLINYTRHDIAYAVSRLSRYTHNPNKEHWDALRRLLKLKVNSTSGYVFTLGGGALSWKSAKQTCIARSTMESEFIALELAGIAKNYAYNGKRRHIRLRHSAVKELLKNGIIFLDYARSEGTWLIPSQRD
ncbi:UNVERIFIED_CONTAM: Retrovirus-related Pol polyprotein from transposon TNT 1-94 [Sesamum calycinum]|uniref:Retrovirus-related Pol polyprotein from transposon TNT 1-94 n=1 Tax=Sesamum calycinum TaxID=2727403 RepID=A0AAW2MCL8_9LAMI